MSVIPMKEFIERVKRLFVLFPGRTHRILKCDTGYDPDKFIKLVEEHGFKCNSIDYYFLISRETQGPILAYYYRTVLPLGFFSYHVYGIYAGTLGVGCNNVFIDVSVDNPYIPKLQCDILEAIFGKEWINYYTFIMEEVGTLLPSKLEKLP